MAEALSGKEIIGVYLFLKERETELDPTLTKVVMRIEKALYGEFSIDEFERLPELYRENSERLDRFD